MKSYNFKTRLKFTDEKIIHTTFHESKEKSLKIDERWYVHFRPDVYDWMEENKIDYKILYDLEFWRFYIFFRNLESLILFKLTWCGSV